MPKFFISHDMICDSVIRLGVSNTAHLKALRLRTGETMTVSDGCGRDYKCIYRGIESGEGIAEILAQSDCQSEPSLQAHVFAALPKGDKTETIIQKAVELGAADVSFFLSARCISRPEDNAMRKRLERLNRVSEEAAMQSGRGRIPAVLWIPQFSDMLSRAAGSDLSLFLWEEAEKTSLRSAMQTYSGKPDSLALVSGPEGGFSREEAEQAAGCGLIPITLGKRILRCETAPICALSAVMYETENLE